MIKKQYSKRLPWIVLGVVAVMIFAWLMMPALPPKDMSSVETVEYFFEKWNGRKWKQQASVLHRPRRMGAEFGFQYVKLISCEEETDLSRIHYDERLHQNPYDISMVRAEFEISYKRGNGDGFKNGIIYPWSFYLIKETADSSWKIIMYGAE